jgi:uncharacterized protein YndB with AHSA1/START domain
MSDPVPFPPGTPTVRYVRIERFLDASPERVYRVWTNPDSLAHWFPDRVEGSLAPASRTILVWPRSRVWWDVVTAETPRRFVARWPWGQDEKLVTTFTVSIEPAGYGSRIVLEDGPFPIDQPGGLEAYIEAEGGWHEAMTMLRAFVDFSIDVRDRH